MNPRMLAAALLLLAGCATGPAPTRAAGDGEETAAMLAARLRDYVYATYHVQAKEDEAALAKLRDARVALADAMVRAGLGTPDREQGLAPLVRPLAAYFASHSDLVFLPLPPEASGVALVRVAERREVMAREVGGRRVSYRVVIFDEMPIEDLERRTAAGKGGPPHGSVASASGSTIFLDRGLARRIAREVVIPRAAAVREQAARARAGEATPAELKDVLRFRALEPAIAEGEAAVARAIVDAEELRIAALLAVTADLTPEQAGDAAVRARANRDAILSAAVEGDPRYQLASAIATALAAPGTPAAAGAEAALEAVSGERDPRKTTIALATLGREAMRERARAALAAR
jgi:hypothetical protein